jgi:hypothetical protein
MRLGHRVLHLALVAGCVAAAPVAMVGCVHHGYYEGSWTVGEEPHYEAWEVETHRDHRDWSARNASEQHEYWSWRHDHQ